MTPEKRWHLSIVVLALFLVVAGPARAQAPELTERLPADTLAYVYWRGAQSISPSSQNALVALWQDPGFAPARQAMEEGFSGALKGIPRSPRLSAADVQALLAHPMIIGLRLPEPGSATGGGAKTPARLAGRIRSFGVFQTTSEEAGRLRAMLVAASPQAAAHIRITSAGFLVSSTDPSTIEELARRFGASPPPETDSLTALPAYHEARAELAGRPTIEFFLQIPPVSSLPLPVSANFNGKAFFNALHVDRVHVLCGAIDLNSPTALLRGSILGDTTPGSVFDFFGASAGDFDTLAAAPAGSSVTAFRIDLGALVSLLSKAATEAMGPDQAGRVQMVYGMFSTMVLPSLAGEYATIRPPAAGPQAQRNMLFVTTIHSQAAGQLFSTTLAPYLHPAGEEGEIRYFQTGPKPSAGASPGKTDGEAGPGTGAAGRQGGGISIGPSSAAFVALTPHLLLASTDEALVRSSAHAVAAASPSPGGLAADLGFRAARAELPAQLSTLTYVDFARIPWTSLFQHVTATSAKEKKSPQTNQAMTDFESWAKSDAATVLARHLHWLVTGSWKDPSGVHWRGDIH